MLARVKSLVVAGIDAREVDVEIDVAAGLPGFSLVGLPDEAIRESRDRVKSAIKNSGFEFLNRKITVNLAPADLKKEGPSFDLPIAVGLLTAFGYLKQEDIDGRVFCGELSLDGSVRPINGILPMVISMKQSSQKSIIIPFLNGREASIVKGVDIYCVKTLAELTAYLKNEIQLEPVFCSEKDFISKDNLDELDFKDVKGQSHVKRGLEVAAAGGHNVLLIGPPGSGKTMLAKRIPSIVPEMVFDEILETTKIYSVAGQLINENAIMSTRPFRAPHHTISDSALVGGGTHPKPGEISLAHNGILFLDELPEFKRNVLEALRQPIEEAKITVSRVSSSYTYPAKFMLITAMNPCPCGYFTDPKKACHCSPTQIQRYLSKVSGPLLDRIDIHIEVPAVRYSELSSESEAESSEEIRKRVNKARDIQTNRYKKEKLLTNSQLKSKKTRQHCKVDDSGKELLKYAIVELGLSARAYDKILKVSRTIADLEGAELIKAEHVSEAIGYRSLDRNIWLY